MRKNGLGRPWDTRAAQTAAHSPRLGNRDGSSWERAPASSTEAVLDGLAFEATQSAPKFGRLSVGIVAAAGVDAVCVNRIQFFRSIWRLSNRLLTGRISSPSSTH